MRPTQTETPVGIEPTSAALQAAASPFGSSVRGGGADSGSRAGSFSSRPKVLLPQQRIRPGGVVSLQRRLGIDPVIDVLEIAAVPVTLVDQILQVEIHVGVAFAERHPDDRQAVA